MLQQTLTYYVSGSAITISNDNGVIQTYLNSTYEISGSSYETGSGGFKSTVATIRINVISGSILLASFPYDETNLVINSSSNLYFPTPLPNLNFQLNYQSEIYPNSPYSVKVTKSSSLEVLTESGVPNNFINLAADSSSKYIIEAYTGDNKYNELALYDATSSLILTSSWITGSGSVVLNLTGSSFYFIDINTSGSTCCSPTLTAVEGLGYERLSFTYTTGSCGTFDSMSVFQSTDSVNWNIIASGSSFTNIISDSGSYPVSTSYYRLIQHCDDGMNMYNSDPSNVLSFTPYTSPTIPNFYNVNIVGRCNSGSLSEEFNYSPDSGSTYLSLGYFNYTTTYQPITSFFIYSGSTLIIDPNISQYGIGYNNSFLGYSTSSNYSSIISASTTIYLNVDVGLSASYTATLIGRIYSGSYTSSVYYGITAANAVTAALSSILSASSYQTFGTFPIQSNQPLYIKPTLVGISTASYGFGYNDNKYNYSTTTNSGSLYIKEVNSDVILYINIKSGSKDLIFK